MPIPNPNPTSIPGPPSIVTAGYFWIASQNTQTNDGSFSTGPIQADVRPAALNQDGTYVVADSSESIPFYDPNIWTLAERRPAVDAAIGSVLSTVAITVPTGTPASLFMIQVYGACLAAAAQAQAAGA
jgi:hypothetical protein